MGNYRVAGDDIFRLGFVDSPSPEGLGAGDVSGASADAMNGVPTGDDLFRLGFADPLTGACRPGLAENSPPDCFPGAVALLKEKAGGRPLRRCAPAPLGGEPRLPRFYNMEAGIYNSSSLYTSRQRPATGHWPLATNHLATSH